MCALVFEMFNCNLPFRYKNMPVCLYFSLLVVPITIIKTKVFTTVPVVEQNCSSITFLYHLDVFCNSWYICGVGCSVVVPCLIFKLP